MRPLQSWTSTKTASSHSKTSRLSWTPLGSREVKSRLGKCSEMQMWMEINTSTMRNSWGLCSLAELFKSNYFHYYSNIMGDFWKATSDLFTGLIERPKMSEKLLIRPPFKYLYDIVMETIKKTNCGNGNAYLTQDCTQVKSWMLSTLLTRIKK